MKQVNKAYVGTNRGLDIQRIEFYLGMSAYVKTFDNQPVIRSGLLNELNDTDTLEIINVCIKYVSNKKCKNKADNIRISNSLNQLFAYAAKRGLVIKNGNKIKEKLTLKLFAQAFGDG